MIEWAFFGRLEVCCKQLWKNHHRNIFPLIIPCEKCSKQPLVDYSMLVHNSTYTIQEYQDWILIPV
jgi:hypothetical protein